MPDFSDIPDEAVTEQGERILSDLADREHTDLCNCDLYPRRCRMAGNYTRARLLATPGYERTREVLSAALPVLNNARDAETEALRAELEQHRSGESYEIGENYGRTTEANSCVRDLLEAVYPGDPMPDRPLDTVWEHLLEQVRKRTAELDELRRQIHIYTAGAQRCGNPAVHKGCARVLKHDGGCSTYPLSDVDKVAASLRGEQ